jgi:hypothetical protein
VGERGPSPCPHPKGENFLLLREKVRMRVQEKVMSGLTIGKSVFMTE